MESLLQRVELLRDKIKFYIPHANWHKLPILRDVLCWMGRHDFEFVQTDGFGGAQLECFYCQHVRWSRPWKKVAPIIN